jgi:hypothetical protein
MESNSNGMLKVSNMANPKTMIAVVVEGKNQFPVFENDNLEKILHRYEQMFPAECAGLIQEIQEHDEGNEDGMSKFRLAKKVANLPAIVYYAMLNIDRSFWVKDNFKGLFQLKALAPKLFSKSKAGKL